MSLVGSTFVSLSDNPVYLLLILLALLCVFLFGAILSSTQSNKNPFGNDTRVPIRPKVYNQSERDKVLKQGFTKKRIPDDLDTIVIGSGIGGLSTAALLAKAGKKVLVLEQHDQAGGCCHTFIEKGFEFDVGIHYVGNTQRRTLGKTLIEQISDGQIEWHPLDQNFDTVAIGPPGEAKMYPWLYDKPDHRQSLVKAFPDEEEAIDKFLAICKKAHGSFIYFVLLKLLPHWLMKLVVRLGLLNLFTSYGLLAKTTTQEFLDKITKNDHLKAVLAYCFGDYGTCPADSSILMHALLINHFVRPCAYPVGGASEIAYNIIPVIERSGGRVLVRAKVTKILFENGKAVGVRVNKGGEEINIFAGNVVSDAGLMNTLQMLPEDVAAQSRVVSIVTDKKLKNGAGALNLFVGLKGSSKELGLKAQNVWAYTNTDLNGSFHHYMDTDPYADNAGDIPLLFVSFPSAKDPSWENRYPGKSVCTVVTLANWEWFEAWKDNQVKHRGDDYEDLKDILAKRMWNQVLKLYPHLEDKVEYFEAGSPVTNKYYIGSDKGEIYGLDHNAARFDPEVVMKLRSDIGIPGLYLTGQDIFTCGFFGALFGGLLGASAVLNRNLFIDCISLHNKIKKQEKKRESNAYSSLMNGNHHHSSEDNSQINGVSKKTE